jgi:hypothetical protein
MTPKEKAEELVNKFYEIENNSDYFGVNWKIAKQCALIAVDEVIQQLTPIEKAPNNKSAFQYWQEVKNEIEKI